MVSNSLAFNKIAMVCHSMALFWAVFLRQMKSPREGIQTIVDFTRHLRREAQRQRSGATTLEAMAGIAGFFWEKTI
jgi:hypothetical protein